MLQAPPLVEARGPISELVVAALRGEGRPVADDLKAAPIDDDDFQLALYALYELHYRGWADVDPDREWDPALLALRHRLEARFVQLIEDEIGPRRSASTDGERVIEELIGSIEAAGGPSLSSWVEERGSFRQLQELAIHRSPYQLKEADPHTWAIPRLPAGRAKSALLQLQFDEYGNGQPGASHAELFADTMTSLGLDSGYGRHLGSVPGVTLATVNLLSMFGLHRRWVGACLGHLAVFETTSVVPMTRYASAHRRITGGEAGAEFYDVHVTADAVHEQVVKDELLSPLLAANPDLGPAVLFGARALLALERRFAEHVIGRWDRHRSSLLGDGQCLAAAS